MDTSVLCNLVPVPGRCQQEASAREEFQRHYTAGDELVLPVTAVVETGNFIAQLDDGGSRRRAAAALEEWLGAAVSQTPPFSLHDFSWDASTVQRFLEGAGTGERWVGLATRGIGAGDLLILTEPLPLARLR
ncbi:hypothetical protein SAMN06264364_1391 [Quadrisphaera granulorum]|uniref:PIN domain-containing protein n=1 Tax=Quadrisphaera granulorum TaxID=317664 RepID=A0A315ZQJ6_9ACTN|nr:hypothetical protein [Quadrisphaera granulorum]PWJ47270.1 hypothetical protein BXY45_1391 [Quadrisphaera granulorum]SZE98841.1 hypothetical protein SAMN06264364_1391 [Quadrisphaera granulorum]